MKYYKNLYLSDSFVTKKEKIIQKLNTNKLQFNVFLVTIPSTKHNQLEIINSQMLLQPSYPKENLFIVGIFASYEEAVEMIEDIAQKVYSSDQGTDIRNYILKKEQED